MSKERASTNAVRDGKRCRGRILITLLLVFVAVSGLFLAASPARADVQGKACVVDGDTLSINGKRRFARCMDGTMVRLYGVIAPPLDHLCPAPDGRTWRCGQAAASNLLRIIQNRQVYCSGSSMDRRGRILGTCLVGGRNLNEWLVRNGWAVAYPLHTMRFSEQEALARQERRGIWQSADDQPLDWRNEED